jgi:hypothetical protein
MRKARIIAVLVAAMSLPVASAEAHVLPVGTWQLNEGSGSVAHDSIGDADGTLQGGPDWTDGRFLRALDFNGSSAVVVKDRPRFDSSAVSVSAWVSANGSPGNFEYVVAKGASGCSAASYGLYTGPNGGLVFYVSSDQGLTYTLSPDAGAAIWDGNWHNVVGTFDGSKVRLFVDGRQVGSGTPGAGPIDYGLPTSNDLSIGDYLGCSLGFSGRIDQVRVFDRALEPGEIDLGYRASRLLPPRTGFDLVL